MNIINNTVIGGRQNQINARQDNRVRGCKASYTKEDRSAPWLSGLADELGRLREQMEKHSSKATEAGSVQAIADAEIEAKRGDVTKTFAALKRAGKWAVELGNKIGLLVAAEAVKKSIGL